MRRLFQHSFDVHRKTAALDTTTGETSQTWAENSTGNAGRIYRPKRWDYGESGQYTGGSRKLVTYASVSVELDDLIISDGIIYRVIELYVPQPGHHLEAIIEAEQ